MAHCTLGEVDKAVEVFEEWLEEEPDNPIARHMLAACSGRDVPPRASDAFVEKTFDSFAASFDSKLAKLSYRAPALVAEMLAESDVEATKSLDVLDAGCGTGLCGPLIAPYARRLVGVDLSAPMIAQAQARNVYDELVKRELTAYLRDSTGAFDVIVSADTLVYFGQLEDVAAASANALRPGGRLVFTVEELVGAGSAMRGTPSARPDVTAIRVSTSSVCWRRRICGRRSCRRNCVSKPAIRSRGSWCEGRNRRASLPSSGSAFTSSARPPEDGAGECERDDGAIRIGLKLLLGGGL